MPRLKLAIYATIAVTVVLVAIMALKSPTVSGLFSKIQPANSNNLLADQKSADVTPVGLIEGAKDYVSQTAQSTTQSLGDAIEGTKKQIATSLVGDSSNQVTVSIPPNAQDIKTTDQNLLSVDLSQKESISLNLKKETSYYIIFKNVPKNTCLYINEMKYQIESEKLLQVQFQNSGNYTLSTNACDLNFKSIGTLTVDK